MKTGAQRILDERARHEAKGWTATHDDKHDKKELVLEAEYLLTGNSTHDTWGLVQKSFNEGGRIRQLTVAGALIAAEIDRLQRLFSPSNSPPPSTPNLSRKHENFPSHKF